jgi:hypothetical protein
MSDSVVDWLVAGDPAIRWQAERDLLDEPPECWETTRSEIAETGWGRDLLDQQDDSGTWGGGLYQPKWTSTTYTLLLLRRFGLAANDAALAGCVRLLDDADWVDGGVSYWSGRLLAERCVNGMVLSVVSHFGVPDPRVDSIAELLVEVALSDGGWNCRDHQGASHSSLHTTISVLEGLLEWKRRAEKDDADAALAAGHEFLLNHQMYKSHRTGAVINEAWTTFHFPPRWHYDVMRGLDHLRDAKHVPDDRAGDAVGLVAAARRRDGRWPKGPQYSGQTFFPLEPGRAGGRWNTLRALRVLRWWEEGTVLA